MPFPYFGISDFTSLSTVESVLSIFRARKAPSLKYKFQIAVMMNPSSLHGEGARLHHIYPPREQISAILSSNEAYNCLRYTDYGKDKDLWKSLAKAISYGGFNLDALQLDMVWPDRDMIKKAVPNYRNDLEVILQIGHRSLHEMGNDPRQVVEKLSEYQGIIHRVFLDNGGGGSHHVDHVEILPYLALIHRKFPDLGLGIACGIGAEGVREIAPLVAAFPNLSFAAKGSRLGSKQEEPIDPELAEKFIADALQLLSPPQQ
jgi:hypothetical protein